jgi:outer membrane protein OmpA-like peptidoglycan-associated protein
MQNSSHIDIYGIGFTSDNHAINEEDSKILKDVLKYLEVNPNLAVIVESHKFSTKGSPQDDLEMTRKRADAVVGWLVANGVAAGRLQPKARGRTKPLT